MRILAALLMVGALATLGWVFRQPIMTAVNRYFPESQSPSVVAPATAKKKKATSTEQSAGVPGTFNPDQQSDASSNIITPEDLAAMQAAQDSAKAKAEAGGADSPTNTPPAPDGVGLVEVTPKSQPPTGPQTQSAEGTASLPENESSPRVEVSEAGQPAAEALLKFLNARDLTERLKYTLAAPMLKPHMERYYRTQPDGPVKVDSIGLVRMDPKPQMGGGAHAVFGVESRAWEYPIPVMLEEGKEGFQVDWLSFVEFKDRLLERFFEEYQEGAARFHVGITRTHYFDDKVPNTDNKDAFKVMPAPPNPFTTTVFVEKDSQLGRELKDRIPWGAQVWAIVELEWVKLGSQQWVQLVAVPQLNWYSVPSQDPKMNKSGEIPDEIQKAVPVGR